MFGKIPKEEPIKITENDNMNGDFKKVQNINLIKKINAGLIINFINKMQA